MTPPEAEVDVVGDVADEPLRVPAMDVAASIDPRPTASVRRVDANAWLVAYGDAPSIAAGTDGAAPSAILAGAAEGVCLLARLELDRCGAWVTVANRGGCRPVAVRRAGWVDVRGQPASAVGPPTDDRVGLGPGDALVLGTADLAGAEDGDDHLLDALLATAGGSAAAIVEAVGTTASIVVVAVPDDLGDDPLGRIVLATGVAADRLELPGYPLGDQQPELWAQPPAPPRLARLRLGPEVAGARSTRALLDRLLASWRLDGRIADDDLKLLASEVTTNAIVHARTAATVTVRYLGDVVRFEVDDASPDLPRMRTPDPTLPGGRGLHLVEALSQEWGVEPSPGGKRVWFDVAVHPPADPRSSGAALER